MVEPRILFPVIALVFVLLAAARWSRSRGKPSSAARTCLWMAVIFGVVSWWLNYR
ncbi:MAG: hypothetical protein JSR40_00175 [Proteobacteria bacterium]|nr:hypothetical protein [Pseudomonadota bacterium]